MAKTSGLKSGVSGGSIAAARAWGEKVRRREAVKVTNMDRRMIAGFFLV